MTGQSRTIIRNGHIIDPSQGIDGPADMIIENGKVLEVRYQAQPERREKKNRTTDAGLLTIDAAGCYVIPGLIDMHVHLREPGYEHKETIRTGTLAAARGGFTTVCAMPNTSPVNDNESVTEFILRKASAEGACTVLPIGAVTKGQKGEELAEMGMMHAAGCVAFSDDGHPVMNSLIMRRALEYVQAFNVPVISHCEDLGLSDGGVMHEGAVSGLLGLRGVPAAAEEVAVARDIALAALTGGRLHIAHVSTRGSVELIRRAKEAGVSVTAETCPHYFSLTEEAVAGYNTDAKVNPPLRTEADLAAVLEGLRDGTIDVIATDHAPHHRDEKLREFDRAPSGISGLETALSISLGLVAGGTLTMKGLVEKMVLNPARILRLDKGTLRAGADADLVVVDPRADVRVDPARFASKGKNTPFAGMALKGAPVVTICGGRVHKSDTGPSHTEDS